MILDYLLHKAEKTLIPVDIELSRCNRFRFSESSCDDCLTHCPFYAISISESIEIDEKKCEGCLICSSVCKNEAISASIKLKKFEELSREQNEILIGCTKGENIHHFRSSCIGWLSMEVLAYLGSTFKDGVNIDVSLCKDCVNNPSVEYVSNLIEKLKKDTGNENIQLIDSRENLQNHSKVLGRRDFLNSIFTTAKSEVGEYLSKDEKENLYFSDPKLTLKLNAIKATKYRASNKSIESMGYRILVKDNCDSCLDCVAICPTEALKESETEELEIDNSRCTGCELCSEFCLEKAIQVDKILA